MPGVLGLCFRSADFSEVDTELIKAEVAAYKSIRPLTRRASPVLLTDQVQVDATTGWDAIEFVSGSNVVLFAYRSADATEQATLHLKGLSREATYEISSYQEGPLATATGAQLMDDGIQLDTTPGSMSHLLILKRERGKPPS